jgi:hypothetical protein
MGLNQMTDEEYGTVVLKEGRPVPKGHYMDIRAYNDIEALKTILDEYIVCSEAGLCNFTDHKLAFALEFLDGLYLLIDQKYQYADERVKELCKRESDIEHKVIEPMLKGGAQYSTEEKCDIFDKLGDTLEKRRKVKDAEKILEVFRDNIEKTRNFIIGMNQRRFSPKSEYFQRDESYKIGPKQANKVMESKES